MHQLQIWRSISCQDIIGLPCAFCSGAGLQIWHPFGELPSWSPLLGQCQLQIHSADTLLCLSLEEQDCLEGVSSEVASHSDLVTWEFALLRLANKIAQGQSSMQLFIKFFPRNFPGLDDDVLREI